MRIEWIDGSLGIAAGSVNVPTGVLAASPCARDTRRLDLFFQRLRGTCVGRRNAGAGRRAEPDEAGRAEGAPLPAVRVRARCVRDGGRRLQRRPGPRTSARGPLAGIRVL